MGSPALNNLSLSSDGPYQTFVSHLAVVLLSSRFQIFLPPIHLFMAVRFGFLKYRSNCCTFFLINLILWMVESRLLPVVKKPSQSDFGFTFDHLALVPFMGTVTLVVPNEAMHVHTSVPLHVLFLMPDLPPPPPPLLTSWPCCRAEMASLL